ncbi:PAS domain S-box [Rivularia sp. PCC 7116]|uniref:ATP-binding protein n=1 Tax=Rivularia sp. PCC 7116 TaxID=373994 RepID=UPI00029F31E9|nr:ATP-binding protein [Rivularia sp. PCC 7116]AFY53551.1 PAS domain S-box [Rivularia sp. PCC 7116]
MDSLFKNILSLRRIEYLIVNQNWQILELSPKINILADNSNEVSVGKDVRIGFPELIGIEVIASDILAGKQDNFELKGVIRTQKALNPIYIDICIANNLKSNQTGKQLLIVVEDVTERMLLEQSLVQGANEANLLLRTLTASKQYIDQVVTSMADALLVTTPSGKIKNINRTAQLLLEYEEAEIYGKPISNVLKEVDSWKAEIEERGNIKTTLFGPITPLVKEVETVCQTKTGKIIPVAFSCSKVQTEIEHFQGYVYIIRDMTERKQAELAKQEFLAMISHEIRTPVAAVIGMGDILLNTDLTTQQEEFVETICNSGKALLEIINDILDFSKVESGKLEIEEEPFHLNSCIEEAISLLLPKAKEKKLEIIFHKNPEIPEVIVGDISRLRQVFINLLSNAIKFTETGNIEILLTSRKRQIIGNERNNYEIQFAVKDTGVGIPSNRIDRLFKAFSQVNSSITRKYGGTGLGLAICKQLSELMGGKIWVETEPDKGSTFYFTISTRVVKTQLSHEWETKAEESHLNIDATVAEKNPLKILLVEDYPTNQKIITLMLQRMGYQPDIANNGLEALSALRHQSYDVVLMDMQMPEMDGMTATEYICQEWDISVRPRIIALTASAMSSNKENYLASGIDDFLAKPFPIQQLMQLLNKYRNHKQEASKKTKASHREYFGQNNSTIDATALQEIYRIADFNCGVDPRIFLLETIDDYLEETPKILQKIEVALSEDNLKNLQLFAHKLSSSSATLGANKLAALCTQLEIMVISEMRDEIAEHISKVEAEYEKVESVLLEKRGKY